MITLSNGSVLNGSKMQEDSTGGFSLTKATVRELFKGKTATVIATCTSCPNGIHSEEFAVKCRGGVVLSIGCKEFTEDDIKLVKKWLKR